MSEYMADRMREYMRHTMPKYFADTMSDDVTEKSDYIADERM